jgi:hypothetical protein
MKEIPLTQGKVALVDDEDYEELSKFKWYAELDGNAWYARRTVARDGRSLTVLMHRVILKLPIGIEADHVNRDGLDNRRKNLRSATHAENGRNRRLQRNNTVGYRGVYRARHRFAAAIKVNDRTIYLGRFDTPESAGHAYDDAARLYFGEFAYLNYPKQSESEVTPTKP